MSNNRISKTDITDIDIIDAYELVSDGNSVNSIYLTTTCISTTSGTKTVVVNLSSDGEGIFYSFDHPAESGDIVYISGTSGGLGDGYFTINSVINDTTFTINETFGTSTGGSVQYRYPAGAKKVGFDSTSLTATTSNNVQQALFDLALSVGSTTIDYDFLLDNEPPRPNNTYTNTFSGNKVIQEKWKNTLTTNNIKTIDYTYSGTKVITEVRKIYNTAGITVVAQMTINYSYTGTVVTSETVTRDI